MKCCEYGLCGQYYKTFLVVIYTTNYIRKKFYNTGHWSQTLDLKMIGRVLNQRATIAGH